jgi:hypothetical protein
VTISISDRERHAADLLRRLFERVGLDTDYDSVFFNHEAPEFSDLPPTTWAELRDWKRLKLVNGGLDHRLTGSGWKYGLRRCPDSC